MLCMMGGQLYICTFARERSMAMRGFLIYSVSLGIIAVTIECVSWLEIFGRVDVQRSVMSIA